MISDKRVLYIEPSAQTSKEPVIDALTMKLTAAFRRSTPGAAYRGFHMCACGVCSDNCNHTLPNGESTNSLCVHYLAFHRAKVPEEQLEKVRQLDCGEEEPTLNELHPPRRQ